MQQTTINKSNVEKRIRDWKKRLNALFEEVDGWRRELLPESQPQTEFIEQTAEEIMKESGVAPQQLPVYSFVDKNRRVSFVPTALWVMGANGRVRVTADHPNRSYLLVDLGGKDGAPSDWQVADANAKKYHVPFNRETLKKIIENRL